MKLNTLQAMILGTIIGLLIWLGLAFLFLPSAHAFDLDVTGSLGLDNAQKYNGGKIALVHNSGLYASITASESQFHYKLPGPKFDYYGIGIGSRYLVLDYFLPYIEVGYFIPDLDYHDQSGAMAACNNEMGYQLLNDRYKGTHWQYDPNQNLKNDTIENIWFDIYEIEADPAIGFELGILARYPLFKNLHLIGGVGYRWLEFPYRLAGYWEDVSTGWLETYGDMDVSSWQTYFGFSCEF